MRGTTHVPSIYIILRHEGKIAFVLRQNTGFMDGKYTLPAGHVEGTETYREAAAREAKEEVGIDIDQKDLRFVHLMERFQDDHVRVDVLFEVDAWRGEPINAEPDVHGELVWFSVDKLPFGDIMPFESAALRCIATGGLYSEFGWDQK